MGHNFTALIDPFCLRFTACNVEKISDPKNMLTITPPPPYPFSFFSFYLFSFTFQKKSEQFFLGGGFEHPEHVPLKYALVVYNNNKVCATLTIHRPIRYTNLQSGSGKVNH